MQFAPAFDGQTHAKTIERYLGYRHPREPRVDLGTAVDARIQVGLRSHRIGLQAAGGGSPHRANCERWCAGPAHALPTVGLGAEGGPAAARHPDEEGMIRTKEDPGDPRRQARNQRKRRALVFAVDLLEENPAHLGVRELAHEKLPVERPETAAGRAKRRGWFSANRGNPKIRKATRRILRLSSGPLFPASDLYAFLSTLPPSRPECATGTETPGMPLRPSIRPPPRPCKPSLSRAAPPRFCCSAYPLPRSADR